MARQRTLEKERLFEETEKLLLEEGYHSFHFQALSKRLGVARSTIYNYYSKKEELVTEYMMYIIDQIMQRMEKAAAIEPFEEKLKAFLRVWIDYADIHQSLQILPVMDHHASPLVEKNVERLFSFFGTLNRHVQLLIEEGKASGHIDRNLSGTALNAIIMSLVRAPNAKLSRDVWVDTIYAVLTKGMSPG